MGIDVVGSRMAPDAMYGQNGSDTPSSIQRGDAIKRSKIAKTIIAADGSVSAAPGDWETRKVNASPIASHPGMKNPNASPAKVPMGLCRGCVVPSSVQPAKPGNAKR